MLSDAMEFDLNLSGGTVHAVRFGEGKRKLVIIEGLTLRPFKGSAAALRKTYRAFAKHYTVYLFDRKDPLPEPCTTEALAEDLWRSMKAAGIDRADLFGISQGGTIAQYLAIGHPEAVGKAVFAVTLSRPNDTVKEAIGEWIRFASQNDYESLIRDFIGRLYTPKRQERYRAAIPLLLKLTKTIPSQRFVSLAKACLTADTYDRLSQIRCSCFVIGGEDDRVVSAQASRELAEKLGAELYLYEGLGHAASEEAKDFNTRVLEFLLRDSENETAES